MVALCAAGTFAFRPHFVAALDMSTKASEAAQRLTVHLGTPYLEAHLVIFPTLLASLATMSLKCYG